MKNPLIGILAVIAIVCGVLYVDQSQKTTRAEVVTVYLQRKTDNLQSRLAQQEEQIAGLRNQLQVAQVEVARLDQSLTNRALADERLNATPASLFSQVFKRPEMRELVKSQQKAVFSSMIDRNYAKLCVDLRLSPDQCVALKELVLRKLLVDADAGVSMMSEEVDAAKRVELMQQARADKDAIDEEIKLWLGDDNYDQFQAYEKTQPERMAIAAFKDQLATTPIALTAGQERRMIRVLTEQRQNFKFTVDYSDPTQFMGDPAVFFAADKLGQFQLELAELDERYLACARDILSPGQFAAFEQFLASQREMQHASMQMAGPDVRPQRDRQSVNGVPDMESRFPVTASYI